MRAYLDHASASPLRPQARAAMIPFLTDSFGDPARIYFEGQLTRIAVENARESIAEFFGARTQETVFTSGPVESINHAVRGAIEWGRQRVGIVAHAVISAAEHSAVRLVLDQMAVPYTVVGIDSEGRIDPKEVASAILPDTVLVSIQFANHEVGTLQPVGDVVNLCASEQLLIHVDAHAAAGVVPVDFARLGADLMSVGANSLGGPAGAGALFIRRGLRIPSLILGGSQERDRRAGLENVATVVGFGAAARDLISGKLEREAEISQLHTDRLMIELVQRVPDIEIYGDPIDRLPSTVCFGLSGVEAEPVVVALDNAQVAVHSGSACASESIEPSPVLEAMGVDASRSIRVSVGWTTTEAEIDHLILTLPDVVQKLRSLVE